MKRNGLACLLLASGLLCVNGAARAEVTARIMKKEKGAIRGLKLGSAQAPVEAFADEDGFHAFVTISGTYVRPSEGAILSAGEQDLVGEGKGGKSTEFVYKAPLAGPTTSVDFTAVFPSGQLEHEVVQIEVKSWAELKAEREKNPRQRGRGRIGLGVDYISFRDTRVASVSQLGLAVVGDYALPLGGSTWFLEGFGSFTAIPVGDDSNLRLLNGDLRFGRNFRAGGKLQLAAALGGEYVTTFSSSDQLGFKNAFGPQVLVRARVPLSRGSALTGYAGFCAIMTGYSPSFGGDRRVTAGGEYRLPGETRHPISIGATLNLFHLQIDGPSGRTVELDSTDVLGAVTYGF